MPKTIAPIPRCMVGLQDDNKWEQYFANPQGYFDNRATKNNPRAPDFKSRGDGEALWLNSAPDWAKERLGA